jgi:hypothetical protein
VARHRHYLEVEDEGLFKDLVVIFVFWGALYCSVFLLMLESYSQKKKTPSPTNRAISPLYGF